MRADETDAGASSRSGFMPPVTSRPGVRTGQSIASGDKIAPPSVWRPTSEAAAFSETLAEPAEQPPAELASSPIVLELPAAPETASPFASGDFFEPWAEAAVTQTEAPAEPEAEASAELEAEAPAELEAEAPAELEAEIPAQPEAEAPAELEAEIPAELEAEAPAQPETEAPAHLDAEVEEPTPLLEEFALESFLMPQLEEPAVPQPAVEEPAFEPDIEEPVAEPEPEEVTYEAPSLSDVVTEIPAALQAASPTHDLGERLEKVAHELRASDADAVIRKLAGGDRLDALLAGLLAGFLARSGD